MRHKKNSLTLVNAIDSLNDHKIHLIKIDGEDIDPNYSFNMTLNGVNPTLFSVNDNQMLSVYVFSSGLDKDAGIEYFKNLNATANLEEHEKFSIDNLLIFYILRGDPKDSIVVTAIEGIKYE